MSSRGKEWETNGLVLPGPEKIPGWRDSREETLHPPPRKEKASKEWPQTRHPGPGSRALLPPSKASLSVVPYLEGSHNSVCKIQHTLRSTGSQAGK